MYNGLLSVDQSHTDVISFTDHYKSNHFLMLLFLLLKTLTGGWDWPVSKLTKLLTLHKLGSVEPSGSVKK